MSIVYDGLFSWEGFGGVYQLAAGQCRLRIFDLRKNPHSNVAIMKPYLVVVSDLPDSGPKNRKISVRSCAGHIATQVIQKYRIDPQRMVYVEYTPSSVYGDRNQYVIPAKYETAEFVWRDNKALHPQWRPLETALHEALVELMAENQGEA